jgi:hypothetical protein
VARFATHLRVTPNFHLDDLQRRARFGLEENVVNVLLDGCRVVNQEARDTAAP